MGRGACEKSSGSLFAMKFLVVSRNRKSENPGSAADRSFQRFEQSAVGLPSLHTALLINQLTTKAN